MSKYVKKNLLITGGTGYIGSHLFYSLEKYYNIYIIDNLSNHKHNPIKHNLFYKINLLNLKKLDLFFLNNRIDIVIHLSSKINAAESVSRYNYYYRNIYLASKNLLNICIKYKIKYFVFASSAAVYGSYKNKFSEKDSLRPLNPYGILKKKVELLIKKVSKGNFNYAILRFFNVAGVSKNVLRDNLMSKSVISIIIDKYKKKKYFSLRGNNFLTTDGTSERDYIHVLDIVLIIKNVLFFFNKNNKNLVLNCGTGTKISILDIINVSKKEVKNFFLKIKYYEKRVLDPRSVTSNNKLLLKSNFIRKFRKIHSIILSYI
jgi:UDP-glucose 4-epimerase